MPDRKFPLILAQQIGGNYELDTLRTTGAFRSALASLPIMSTYFHVQRTGVPAFKIGRSYSFGVHQNHFSHGLSVIDPTVHIAGVGNLPIDRVLKDYFDPAGFNHYRRIKRVNHTPDEKGLLFCAAAILSHHAKLLRELVFEQVRQETFVDKPSRMRCIWLIPHDMELLGKWCATAPKNQFRTFEVEATGNFHRGLNKYLLPECLGADQLRDRARHYWSEPVSPSEENAETLCEGEIKILRELKMEGSSNRAWQSMKQALFGNTPSKRL